MSKFDINPLGPQSYRDPQRRSPLVLRESGNASYADHSKAAAPDSAPQQSNPVVAESVKRPIPQQGYSQQQRHAHYYRQDHAGLTHSQQQGLARYQQNHQSEQPSDWLYRLNTQA